MKTLASNYIGKKSNYKGSKLSNEALQVAVDNSLNQIEMFDLMMRESAGESLVSMMEMANISSMFGNFLAMNISQGEGYIKNAPHTFPDLVAVDQKKVKDIEIKVSLERNLPKGHLPKAGEYLICRYSLVDESGVLRQERGEHMGIYEIRFGYLGLEDFNLSSTANDSGKTATIKTESLRQMGLLYFNPLLDPSNFKGKK
jgi:hypothetical protein